VWDLHAEHYGMEKKNSVADDVVLDLMDRNMINETLSLGYFLFCNKY
jgi:hypothetical protein